MTLSYLPVFITVCSACIFQFSEVFLGGWDCVWNHTFLKKFLLYYKFLLYPTTPLWTKPYPYPTLPKTHLPPDRRKADPPPIVWLLAHVCPYLTLSRKSCKGPLPPQKKGAMWGWCKQKAEHLGRQKKLHLECPGGEQVWPFWRGNGGGGNKRQNQTKSENFLDSCRKAAEFWQFWTKIVIFSAASGGQPVGGVNSSKKVFGLGGGRYSPPFPPLAHLWEEGDKKSWYGGGVKMWLQGGGQLHRTGRG